ncbi:MAG: DUF4097 domain-containing protein [Actinomycetota bacterium]|nr:DUF4097 domain-containing protein [Actinomycetota bacterium]
MTEHNSKYEFATPEPVDLKVELSTGEINITASDTSVTTVELEAIHGDNYAKDLIANARVEQHGTKISVIMPKNKGGFFGRKGQVRAKIAIPHESNLKIDTGSADLEARGRFAQANVNSGSGDIEIEQIASGDLKAGSGDVDVENVVASVKVKTGSGDVKLGPIGGSGDIMAGSGDVVLDAVEGSLKVKTGSGDVVLKAGGVRVDAMAGSGDLLIQHVNRGEVLAKTGSGDVTIGVAQGTAAYLDIQTVTGDVTSSLDSTESPLDGDATVAINVISGSGDVVLQRA